ncbi:MAG: type II toxin-antitoxin system HicB family antitoxin [Chloroflexota bacterium]|nr:type II toxin-antitoxin system HicB family antitoxin [Chloroflexota bacterium]
MRFTVVLVPDEDSSQFVAYVPVIPGCVTHGDSIEDALAMALDAATLMLEDLVERDEYVPTEPAGAIVANIEVHVSVPAEAVA